MTKANNSAMNLRVEDVPPDCGNAPRKAVIRDFVIDLYSGNVEGTLDILADNVEWEVVGTTTLNGHKDAQPWLEDQHVNPVTLVRFGLIVTHGTDCGVDGEVQFASGKRVSFCHIMKFSGHSKTAKIKMLRSYLVENEETLSD